jgi:hypothetical protein
MPPSARLTSAAFDHGKRMINAGADRLTSVVRNRKKSLFYVGAALALAGAGSASAATLAGTAAAPLANAPVSASVSTGSVSRATPLAPASRPSAAASALMAPQAEAHAAASTPAAPAVSGQAATSRASVHKHAATPRAAARRADVQPAALRPAAAGQPVQALQANAPHRATGKGRAAVAARQRHAKPARHVGPYIFYDSVTPSAIPAHHLIGTYATGPYAVPAAQVAGRRVMWIDTIGSDPRGASALDIEPTDATPTIAANWVRAKLTADPHAVAHLYTNISEWPAVQAAVATLPPQMRSHIRWWIADPTGYPHIVPGADATQWYWGSSYDISTANPRF